MSKASIHTSSTQMTTARPIPLSSKESTIKKMAASSPALPETLTALQLLASLSNQAIIVIQDGQLQVSSERANALMAMQAQYGSQKNFLDLLPTAPPDHDIAEKCLLLETQDRGKQQYRVRSACLNNGLAMHVLTEEGSLEEVGQALEHSNRELKAMARRLFSAQEDERRAISRDLHDDIGQSITAMRMSAHAAMVEQDVDRRTGDLQHLLDLADQSAARLRDLSMLLRPPQLDVLGLVAALRWQSDVILRNTGITLEMDIRPIEQRPTDEIEQACFRIAQEALTNIVRHANANNVKLLLHNTPADQITLIVSDDGRGFDTENQHGLGLVVMRERAQTAGGKLSLTSTPGKGTLIHCTLPCAPAV